MSQQYDSPAHSLPMRVMRHPRTVLPQQTLAVLLEQALISVEPPPPLPPEGMAEAVMATARMVKTLENCILMVVVGKGA